MCTGPSAISSTAADQQAQGPKVLHASWHTLLHTGCCLMPFTQPYKYHGPAAARAAYFTPLWLGWGRTNAPHTAPNKAHASCCMRQWAATESPLAVLQPVRLAGMCMRGR
jgi:hypothetical protein